MSESILNYYPYPSNWKDLQEKTAKLLSECGFYTEIEKMIETVRVNVNIDVYVENTVVIPKSIILIECKCWGNPVPQTIIHAFRSVVSDYGPNFGYVITKNGFQKGAYAAASNTNIQLLTWEEFLLLFRENWRERMFWRIWNRYNNILHYRSNRRLDGITNTEHFLKLDDSTKFRYDGLVKETSGFFTDRDLFPNSLLANYHGKISFPLTLKLKSEEEIFETQSQLFDKIIQEQNKALEEFDNLFKNRIRVLSENWG